MLIFVLRSSTFGALRGLACFLKNVMFIAPTLQPPRVLMPSELSCLLWVLASSACSRFKDQDCHSLTTHIHPHGGRGGPHLEKRPFLVSCSLCNALRFWCGGAVRRLFLLYLGVSYVEAQIEVHMISQPNFLRFHDNLSLHFSTCHTCRRPLCKFVCVFVHVWSALL